MTTFSCFKSKKANINKLVALLVSLLKFKYKNVHKKALQKQTIEVVTIMLFVANNRVKIGYIFTICWIVYQL